METSIEQLTAIKQYLKQTNRYESKSVDQIRDEMAKAAANMTHHSDITVQKVTIGLLRGEWVIPANSVPESIKQAILYFHGGGFVAGTCEFYRDLSSRVAKSSGVKVK
ncbi:MAG TPA: hypothetical protein VGI33_10270 [Paenibacillus sp.]